MGILTSLFEWRFHPSQDPPRWFSSLLAGWTTATGVTVTPETALQSTAVWAAVRVIAETVASLPLKVYRRVSERGKEPATEHYLYPVLHDQPNTEMTSFELREVLMGHVLTWGNGFAEKEFDGGGRVRALWPLRPDKMRVRRRDGQLEYVYRLPDKMGGSEVVLPAWRVMHLRGLGYDGLVGYSPIHLARQAIGLALALEEHGARFFANGARPGAVLEHPGHLTDEAHRRLRESWEERHMGLEQAHRMAILEEGMKIQEIGIPPEDAQFLETRAFQVAEVARIFRVPPHKIGDLSRSTFSNIEHQSIEFVVDTIRPWLVRWEQTIGRDLLLPSERGSIFAEFLVDGLLRGDIQSRYQAYATGRQNGWLSANDVREMENMNPLDDGDVYLVPLNMIPAGQAGDMRTLARALVRNIDTDPAMEAAVLHAAHEDHGQQQEARAMRSVTARRRLAQAHHRLFSDTAARVLRREIHDVRAGAKKFFQRRDYSQFSLWLDEFYEEHRDFIQRQMEPVYLTYGEAIAAEAREEVSGTSEMTPELEDFIRAYVIAFAARHIGSSIGQIRSVVRDALDADEDPLAALDVRFEEWEERRPEKVANRETRQANNAVARQVYIANGRNRVRWNAFGDTCPYCTHLDGRVFSINAPILTGGVEFQPDGADKPLTPSVDVHHPPAHDGCDCSISAA